MIGHRGTEDTEINIEKRDNRIEELNAITKKIIGCAIEVHRHLGAGLLESIYEQVLCFELKRNGIKYQNQVPVSIKYKGNEFGEYKLDLLVEDEVIVELKAVDKTDPVFEAQLLSYLRLTGKKLGLLININVPRLVEGIKRIII